MKIEVSNVTVLVESLGIGDVFVFPANLDQPYIITDLKPELFSSQFFDVDANRSKNLFPVLSLDNGMLYHIRCDSRVIHKPNAKIII